MGEGKNTFNFGTQDLTYEIHSKIIILTLLIPGNGT